MRPDATQESVDRFYWSRGKCCAGCDWWRHLDSVAGECIRTAPVSGHARLSLIGITTASAHVGAGHIITPREHVCGEFSDAFDWSSLPLAYLCRIGANLKDTKAPK
jgi:hypothetical protein